MEARTMSVQHAARLLGIASNSYRAAARRGEVPVIQIGRRMVVPRTALEKLLGEKLDTVRDGEGAA